MNLPDPMVLVGALTAMTKPVISKDVEVTWRTEMVKSALQLHARPSEEAVRSYHKHLLAEFETLAGASKPKKGDVPKVQAFEASGGSGGNGNPSGGAGAKGGGRGKTCKYFLSPKGCKYGAACRSPHSMAELSKAERFKKCLNCGSEEHRAAECKATRKQDLNKAQEPKPTPKVAQVSESASSTQPIVQATPIMSMDSFRQQQLEAAQATQGVFIRYHGSGHIHITCESHTGRWWSAAAAFITTIHQAFGHHFYHASKLLWEPKSWFPNPPSGGFGPGVGNGSKSPKNGFGGKNGHICPKSTFSGPRTGTWTRRGTFPHSLCPFRLRCHSFMRQARDQVEWEAALEVQVALAGDNTTSMRLTSSGTLLLPPGRDGSIQPIVPMGAIIEQLGYKLIWSAGSCKL